MRRFLSSDPFPKWLRGGVIAVGSFDGFHRGHAATLARARGIAGREECPLIVVTFDPVPARYFHPNSPPLNLTTIDQCEQLFSRSGADAVVVINFEQHLERFSAEQIVSNWLIDELGAFAIITGEHFMFGREREGDAAFLQHVAGSKGVAVHIAPAERDRSGELISSRRIRSALRQGDCESATALLGRPFAIDDTIRHGHKLGRTIGFPTANMLMNDYVRPKYGVYAVRGRLPYGRVLDGVANLGIRPMMEVEEELLETHFFDFTGDLYGQPISIELIAYIRGELKLAGLDELKSWIERDCLKARAILSSFPQLG